MKRIVKLRLFQKKILEMNEQEKNMNFISSLNDIYNLSIRFITVQVYIDRITVMSSTESSGTSVEKNEQVNNEETSQKSPTSAKPFDSSYYKWSKKINQSKEVCLGAHSRFCWFLFKIVNLWMCWIGAGQVGCGYCSQEDWEPRWSRTNCS